MKYAVIYDDSTDRHSARRFRAIVTAERLADKIVDIQARGHVVFGVELVAA